jgi:hypothetical protein
MSTFDWSQNDNGSQIELEIVLHDDAQAPSLIRIDECGRAGQQGKSNKLMSAFGTKRTFRA